MYSSLNREGEGERKNHRERERERETKTETDRQRKRERDRDRDRGIEPHSSQRSSGPSSAATVPSREPETYLLHAVPQVGCRDKGEATGEQLADNRLQQRSLSTATSPHQGHTPYIQPYGPTNP